MTPEFDSPETEAIWNNAIRFPDGVKALQITARTEYVNSVGEPSCTETLLITNDGRIRNQQTQGVDSSVTVWNGSGCWLKTGKGAFREIKTSGLWKTGMLPPFFAGRSIQRITLDAAASTADRAVLKLAFLPNAGMQDVIAVTDRKTGFLLSLSGTMDFDGYGEPFRMEWSDFRKTGNISYAGTLNSSFGKGSITTVSTITEFKLDPPIPENAFSPDIKTTNTLKDTTR